MDSFVFAPRNAAHCISGQNKWLETRGLLGMYAEDWTKCEKLARGPRREVDRWWEASTPIQLGANGQRNKNTRIAFGTINIGAHAKTHMRCTIVSQAFQERGQLF